MSFNLYFDDDGSDRIKEVYADNFENEIKRIGNLIEKYKYVSMDTEFPGFVFQPPINTSKENCNYQKIKGNVDSLKLIQVGLSITDENGVCPPNGPSTWQFNFNFDVNVDNSSAESISLLTASGINFEKIAKQGISMELFGEYLISSGLVLNEDIVWIIFHGSYDFAYLIKVLTSQTLPDCERKYNDLLKLYFPTFYDIRYMIRYHDHLKGSLSKLAFDVEVKRIGSQHQAGSDSLVTGEIFFKLKKYFLSEESIRQNKNILFCNDEYNDSNLNYFNNGTMNQNFFEAPFYTNNNNVYFNNNKLMGMNNNTQNPISNYQFNHNAAMMTNFYSIYNMGGGNVEKNQ